MSKVFSCICSKKACRYYKNGTGECPFGNKCFYLHALPNGTKVDVGPPRRKPKRFQADGQEVPQPSVSLSAVLVRFLKIKGQIANIFCSNFRAVHFGTFYTIGNYSGWMWRTSWTSFRRTLRKRAKMMKHQNFLHSTCSVT